MSSNRGSSQPPSPSSWPCPLRRPTSSGLLSHGSPPPGSGSERGKPDDLKASISASREAVELLRGMRPATVNSSAQRRDLAEREAVILDKMKDLAQALFAYDSAASHTDPHLRDIAWNRENAVLALGTAVSLAQLIFART